MEFEDKQTDEAESPPPPSPGTRLRVAREQRGISQQAVAEKLFLKVSQIADIEADRLDERTSVTFTKGYIRLYAKLLGLDDKLLLDEFETLHNAPKSPAKLQSFSKRVAKQAHDDRWMMVTYGILFLLVAGVVLWWYQQSRDDGLSQPRETSLVTPNPSASVPVEPEVQQTLPQSGSDPALNPEFEDTLVEEPPVAELSQAAQTSSPVSGFEDEPVVEENSSIAPGQNEVAQTDAPTQASNTQVQSADLPNVEVTFTFGADCWVNIEDANGEPIAYGVKQAGRIMTVRGVPPFDVTLGAPNDVAIVYDGEPVDISSFQKGRTARFSLPIQE
ncbi:DUF4115 domain-containing protein [Alteromonas aestuariivivens]|uniref:DUF4115 domain-containing protein n=1 Tax=Alteromonas aestuariivivens TaxID=1938339 RepID=A0A3D8MF73_9ALTE|nr:RodZ domain-containing protein [Alteromonas aestuariivivens]RDV29276.1 DUF4115 domain-containing protein [Alteromonas aestuariivivens]